MWWRGLTVVSGFLACSFGQGTLTLPGSWSIFAVDALYHIYGWDANQRALYKLWAPRYDSITRIGGAPGEEGFLGITAIAPVGNQQLYILDAEGQVIALLGTNLQMLQRLTYAQLPPEISEGYPALLSVGQGGELYLLLRETQEIVKVDPFGRVLLRFGGKLYGPGSITKAARLWTEKNRVYILDVAAKGIVEYDSWGTFLSFIPVPAGYDQGYITSEGQVFWGGKTIEWRSSAGSKVYTTPEAVRDVLIQGGRLFWLGERLLGWFPLP
ncbi:MAG: hypothetical protein N2253_01840 [Bacteroidia bacterium]|nr:hypothetical protein [Bacteroidia bacterium]MCX7763618.1 hypothetical protein [Bacteroidia bacterium]MDW8057731.1 hypothetical protein [Bacteroidia bacterium]